MRYISLFLISFIRIVAITILVANISVDIYDGKITIREGTEQLIVGLSTLVVVDFLIEAFLLNPSKGKRRK